MKKYHDKNIDVLYKQLKDSVCMENVMGLLNERREAIENEYHVNTLHNMKLKQQLKMKFEALDFGYIHEYDVLKNIVEGIDEKIKLRLEKGDFF